MTAREKIEELKENGIAEIKLYANATNAELPLTNSNLETEDFECIVTGNTADFYI